MPPLVSLVCSMGMLALHGDAKWNVGAPQGLGCWLELPLQRAPPPESQGAAVGSPAPAPCTAPGSPWAPPNRACRSEWERSGAKAEAGQQVSPAQPKHCWGSGRPPCCWSQRAGRCTEAPQGVPGGEARGGGGGLAVGLSGAALPRRRRRSPSLTAPPQLVQTLVTEAPPGSTRPSSSCSLMHSW